MIVRMVHHGRRSASKLTSSTLTPGGRIRIACVALCSALLASCKLNVVVPAGGSVLTTSGNFQCRPNTTCVIDIDDENFDSTFIAAPDSGQQFLGWRKRKNGLCGDSDEPCRIDTSVATNEPSLISFLQQDRDFYLEPVFVERTVNADVVVLGCGSDTRDCLVYPFTARHEVPLQTTFFADWGDEDKRSITCDWPDFAVEFIVDSPTSGNVVSSQYGIRYDVNGLAECGSFVPNIRNRNLVPPEERVPYDIGTPPQLFGNNTLIPDSDFANWEIYFYNLSGQTWFARILTPSEGPASLNLAERRTRSVNFGDVAYGEITVYRYHERDKSDVITLGPGFQSPVPEPERSDAAIEWMNLADLDGEMVRYTEPLQFVYPQALISTPGWNAAIGPLPFSLEVTDEFDREVCTAAGTIAATRQWVRCNQPYRVPEFGLGRKQLYFFLNSKPWDPNFRNNRRSLRAYIPPEERLPESAEADGKANVSLLSISITNARGETVSAPGVNDEVFLTVDLGISDYLPDDGLLEYRIDFNTASGTLCSITGALADGERQRRCPLPVIVPFGPVTVNVVLIPSSDWDLGGDDNAATFVVEPVATEPPAEGGDVEPEPEAPEEEVSEPTPVLGIPPGLIPDPSCPDPPLVSNCGPGERFNPCTGRCESRFSDLIPVVGG